MQLNARNIFPRLIKDELDVPWYAILLTVSVLLIIFSIIFQLSGHYHVFGTDKVGQDILYQAVKSIRTGLVIGTLTTLVMLPFCYHDGINGRLFSRLD